MDPDPIVGTLVHYLSHGTPVREDGSQAYPSLCRAAFATEVWFKDPERKVASGELSLCVLNPTGMFFNQHVRRDSDHHGARAGGTWHHPWECEG